MPHLVDADSLFAAIAHRRSMGLSRLDENRPVEREKLEKMLEAANWGQSDEDTEPWRFTVFSGEGRAKLADIFCAACEGELTDEIKLGYHKRAHAAPVWIAIGMTPGYDDEGALKTSIAEELMAVATAVQNLHLMASAMGIAGMWHSRGPSIHPGVAEKLGWGEPSQLLGFMMLGYPTTEWPDAGRGHWDDKVTWVETA